ncbi:aquaporin [Brevundimonas aveniformis]|uniref:aquaporin n=1 Tax=Brevundimonas aveniformis TaxID=370977 RepID=UPI002490C959|nr:MIP/aquaporin family protein [Brevundimonas aveniformis]
MPAELLPLPRRLIAEGVGTTLLLSTVVGSGIMAETLSGGNVALALLANAVATGCILVVLITALGPVSGAHFNPAVSLAFLLRREITPAHAITYIGVQIIASIIGVVLAHLMFDLPALQISTHIRTGPGQWLSEGVAAFGLVLIILGGLAVAPRAVPWLVGLFITAAYWFTASTSFANPAVTVARSLTDTFAGIAPASAPAFIIAQIVGAISAAFVAGIIFKGAE